MVFDKTGNQIDSIFSANGFAVVNAYDRLGNTLFGGIPESYTTYEEALEYAYSRVMQDDGVHIFLHTDQHRHMSLTDIRGNLTQKVLAFVGSHADSLSAVIGLGDVCTSSYNDAQLSAMNEALSLIPREKRIDIGGNHDVWQSIDGSVSMITDWNGYHGYFDNSCYPGYHGYDNRGNEYVIDAANHIKYCCMSTWYQFGGDKYYNYRAIPEVVDYWIDMLSTVDDNDIVILSHCQPVTGRYTWTLPVVDGNEEQQEDKAYTGQNSVYGLDQMIVARKNKTTGSITDSEGNVHQYDFSACTSDIVCALSGHQHKDAYTRVGGVPIAMFDSYLYDNSPMYFLCIRRDGSIKVLKVDEEPHVYEYIIEDVDVE